jgi:hypothetical protein
MSTTQSKLTLKKQPKQNQWSRFWKTYNLIGLHWSYAGMRLYRWTMANSSYQTYMHLSYWIPSARVFHGQAIFEKEWGNLQGQWSGTAF